MVAPPVSVLTYRGFTLVELVMVLAVTAVIVGVGVSATRTYVARSQITESIALATFVERHVERAFARTGLPPADRSAAGLSVAGADHAGRYVDAIEVANGRVDLHFGSTADAAIAGRTLSLTPFETADQKVVWICGNRNLGVGLQPLGFAGGSQETAPIVTPIEARYLPAACR